MKRRAFLKQAAAGVAAGAVAAPAIAQSQPAIQWRLASSFPKSLDTIYGAAEVFSKRLAEITDNKFQVRVFAAGELVPGLQVLDAVQNSTVEMGHTAPYYYVGKDPAFAIGTCLPFGFNARQHIAWKLYGGGNEAMALLYKDYGVHHFACGNTGVQMGGWFRKEIKTVADLKGLKMRIGGLAGQVLAKLGVIGQQIAGGDIYPALERGTIDAAEWVGPYDDEKLGFAKVAKFYHYPGWWEGASVGSLYIGQKHWDALPKSYQSMVETAAGLVSSWMVPKYDAGNPPALKRLIAGGAVLKPFSRPVLQACFDTAWTHYDEVAAKNANFKKLLDSIKAFRADELTWFRVAEGSFDNFVASMSAVGR